jgi:hypothetical protein
VLHLSVSSLIDLSTPQESNPARAKDLQNKEELLSISYE